MMGRGGGDKLVAVFEKCLPVPDGTDEVAGVDVVEFLLVDPFPLEIVDFESAVRGEPVWLGW